MKPIYFPFTYVGGEIAQALAACFLQTTVYQPLADKPPADMYPWIQRGILDMRVPVSESGEAIAAAVKNFMDWANLHQRGAGIKSIFCRLREQGIPFFERSSPSQIVAEMKAHALGSASSKEANPIFLARIFLYLAQEFDRQCREIARELSWSRQKTQDLLQALTMEADSAAGPFEQNPLDRADDAAQYMIPERLEAWTRLFFRDTVASVIFLTHSQTVLDYLRDKAPLLEEVLRWDAIPLISEKTPERLAWQQKLIAGLTQRAENKWTRSTEELQAWTAPYDAAATMTLSIYLLPDQMPRDFFAHCTNIQLEDSPRSSPSGRFKNTLIGLLGF
jgi:hypothetical protein